MRPPIVLALAWTLAGCGEGAPATTPPDLGAPVTTVAGEVHLHDFPTSGHAIAAFVAVPVPRAQTGDDALYELGYPVTRSDGACSLHVAPTCPSGCPARTWCAADATCAPLPMPTWIDGGEVRVTGSRTLPSLHLDWDAASSSYVSDAPPGTPLFAGGETLAVSDARPGLRFAVDEPAPPPVVLAQPDPSAPLALPPSGPLAVRWTPSPGPWRLTLTLTASSDTTVAAALVLCVVDDNGAFDIPASLLAHLPPPPRDVQLEVERAVYDVAPTDTPGVGVIVHAGNIALLGG